MWLISTASIAFVLTLTAVCVWALNTYILTRAPYLQLISFIVVIASLVQIVEMTIKKVSPVLFRELGIYLPLITTNCAILALAILDRSAPWLWRLRPVRGRRRARLLVLPLFGALLWRP